MNKNIKIFVTLLIAVVAIGIALFFGMKKNNTPTSTQTADQTANWKTYTAIDSTFSFKLPVQWTVQPNQVFGSRSVTEFRFQNNPLFTVTLLGNYNQITGQPFKTLEEYLGARNTKSKDFLLDGVKAKRVTDTGQAGHVLPSEEVVVFSRDSKFIVSLFFEPDYYPQAKENKTFDQILSTFKFIDTATSVDTSGWTLYTNKTFGYSLKFPATYQVPPQTEKQKSQLGVDNNIGVNRKSDPSDSRVIMINVTSNNEDLPLADYLNKNLRMYGITGPLVSYNFNGYDSLLNKNLPGTNVFIKRDLYIYGIGSPAASSDKEIGDILATFRFVSLFPTAQSDKAMALLQENLSIQYIQRVIAGNGTKAYLEPQHEKGDVIEINLIEGNFPDNHTTRIDTFMVNVKTGEILVYDVANNKTISLKDWGMDIIQRFPDYGPQKTATVLVQDGSYYGPPFDPSLYQLEISKSEHLFAKSDLVDLKKYLGKSIRIRYREVRGVVMSEQQLVIVDSVEL